MYRTTGRGLLGGMLRPFMICALLVAGPGLVRPLAGAGLPRDAFRVTNYPECVVVYVNDLDLLRGRAGILRAEIRFAGIETKYEIEMGAEYQPPAIIIEKKPGAQYSSVSLTVRDGNKVLFSGRFDLPAVVTPKRSLAPTPQKAFIEPGRFMGEKPEIALPDVAALPAIELKPAARRVQVEDVTARVICDMNYPLISAKNNCAISRQTDHPDDPSRRSIYVPLKSQLYDKTTGRPTKVVHYLAEAPLRPEWLEGKDDVAISMKPTEIKIHSSDKTVGLRKTALLGQGASGLGQVTGALTTDADGNVYFSQVPSVVVRFNIAKQEYECPPVNILVHFADRLPKSKDLPDSIKAAGKAHVSWQKYRMIAAGGDRLFVVPTISAAYVRKDRSSVVFSGIFSMPLDDWDNAEKFKEGLRLHVGSGPTFEHTLYDAWPDPADRGRKIGRVFFADGSLYLTSYPGAHGGPWRLKLNEDGSTGNFGVTDAKELSRARRVRGKGSLCTNASGRIGWWNYGVLTTTRKKLKRVLTGRDDPKLAGAVTVYYDAIGAMRLNPKRHAQVLDSLGGPSLAPSYMAVDIPDRPGHVIGVGEYGYYLADLDLSTAEKGVVKKTYLKLDLGGSPLTLPLRVGLGPYAHVWKRQGKERYLYMGGYTGLTRLHYSTDGKPLPAFRMEPLSGRLPAKVLDQAEGGGIKRYRYLVPGIDDRIFLTGTHTAARAGTAFSGGLMSFNTTKLDSLEKLSYMSRAYGTYHTRARVVHGADGKPVQQFAIGGGGVNKGYVFKMKKDAVPQNQDPKIFLFDCPQGGEPRDLFGFSLPLIDGKGAYAAQAFSRNRRFLVIMLGSRLLSFDMHTWSFTDGKLLTLGDKDAEIWRFSKPNHRFIRTPDDRLMLYAPTNAEKTTATFFEVVVSDAGAISLDPYMTLAAKSAAALRRAASPVIAFVRSPGEDDGSRDLFMGLYWRTKGSDVRVIRDFIPPRVK